LGRGVEGLIGHTQPRRIAARSIAERVAEEIGTTVGELVGYTVRFTDRVGDDTLVKVMTDGILLNEIHHDRALQRYDTLILDEAHERSLNIDFLLGYLRTLLPRRPDLKVIVTSATIDTARFSEHFGGAPVVEVSGRTYPVEIRYRPLDDPASPEPRDQPQAIADAVTELFAEDAGDVLVFCSGEREIGDAVDALTDLELRHTEILPLYGRLSAAAQHRIFQPPRGRRVVVSTNVAETSLTVPGIRAVVDAGTARISRYSRRTKVQQLPIEPISRASADQRAGRCGRLGPGVCIRLYAEDDYAARPDFTEPEIQRTSIASVILQMAALDLGDVESFPFLDPPDSRAVRDGIALLEELGAVDPERIGTGRWLTKLGRRLARIPLDPRLARMLIEADRNDCLREVLVIASALSIQDPRERPADHEAAADRLHHRFRDERSDLLAWPKLWEYLGDERRARTSSQFRKMCREEFLNYRRLREWQDVHAQLQRISGDLGLTLNRDPAEADAIHRSLLAGLLSQIGHKDPDGYDYRGARAARFWISPGSSLFKRAPQWVMAAELVETGRLWARGVAAIRPEWVERAAGHLVSRTYSDPWWDGSRGNAVTRETVTLYGLPLAADRTVLLQRIDPAAARDMFIRHALVAGEWETTHAFDARNRERIAEVLAIEARERRTDLLVDDDAVVAFFDRRIPADVTSVRHFDRWWKDAGRDTPHLLDLSLGDLIDPAATPPDEAAYPEVWRYGDVVIPLEYEFDPASPRDGVTVDVPEGTLHRVDPAAFEWLVPGLRGELVDALIRSLPKAIRKRFVPITDTVAEVTRRLDPAGGGLIESLRRELTRIGGEPIPAGALDAAVLPAHLRPRFRVVDENGAVVAEGDDLGALKEKLLADARESLAETGHPLERDGITGWDLGELPRVVEVGEAGHRISAYPALIDEGDSVAVRLLATEDEQAAAMWAGTRRLLLLALGAPGRLLRAVAGDPDRSVFAGGPYGSKAQWRDDVLAAAVDEVVASAGGPAWDAVGFDRLLDAVRHDLAGAIDRVAATSLAALSTARAVRSRLGTVPFPDVVADLADQLDRLVYPGFIAAVGAGRLEDVLRYLEGAERRLDKLAEDPVGDAARMGRIHRLEAELDRVAGLVSDPDGVIRVAWMLEELRVSFFAQALGTRERVSEKRVQRALTSLELG
jgi:ATP-dependent helicase HrpA